MAKPIPSSKLHALDTKEKTEFMRKVYNLHVASSDRRRDFIGDLPAKEIDEIEAGKTARKDAAILCRQLLLVAREDLEKEKKKKLGPALLTKSIGVASGYRSANRQFRIWRRNFSKYYRLTEEKRKKLSGGEHGDAAARYLKSFISRRLAAPGFSLHNSGIAVDLNTVYRGHRLGPSKSQTQQWKSSWFFNWLENNANNFGFFQNTKIDEPWHWELKEKVKFVSFSEDEEEVQDNCAIDEGDDYPTYFRPSLIDSGIL